MKSKMKRVRRTVARRLAIGATVVFVAIGSVAAAADAGILFSSRSPAKTHAAISPEKKALEDAYKKMDAEQAAISADPKRHDALVAKKRDEKARVAAKTAASSSTDQPRQWPQGIFEDAEAPAPGSVFLGQNRWVGTLGGDSVAVYAGQAGLDPDTGRVLVRFDNSVASSDSGYTLDLAASGPLRVVAASGTLVTVVDRTQTRHVLNLSTRSWVE